jgi:hypothetical protein
MARLAYHDDETSALAMLTSTTKAVRVAIHSL